MFIILCLFECIAFDLVFVNLFLVGPINLLISPNIYIMYDTNSNVHMYMVFQGFGMDLNITH